jgi:hypothetical protein
MRPEWQSAFAIWWPEREPAAEFTRGFTRKTMSKPERVRLQALLENRTHIVSPELLPKLVELHKTCEPGDLEPYDYIVFDEFHEYRSWWSKTFQAMLDLRALYPGADLKPLSGTPLGSDPLRAWAWLKLCEPKKWGTLRKSEEIPFKFRQMYGEKKESEYAFSGYAYTGVNRAALPQFAATIAHLIRRKTPEQVGIQLPAMRFEVKRYPLTDSAAQAAADWAQAALTEQPVAIFTRNHEPMAEIEAEFIARQMPYVRLHQSMTVAERSASVEHALNLEHPAVILATTGLVSTGVNYLANIHTWMLAQPSENPVEIQQLAGRFKRLSSKDQLPRTGYLLYREGEEFSAQQALVERLKTDKALIVPAADALELERLVDGRSKTSLLEALRLCGRSLLAAGDDHEEDEAA